MKKVFWVFLWAVFCVTKPCMLFSALEDGTAMQSETGSETALTEDQLLIQDAGNAPSPEPSPEENIPVESSIPSPEVSVPSEPQPYDPGAMVSDPSVLPEAIEEPLPSPTPSENYGDTAVSQEMSLTTTPSPESSPTPTPVPTPVRDLGADVARAVQLVADGKYLEARQIYDQLLLEPGISDAEKQQFEEGFEKANMQLLMSMNESPESTSYTILPGDSLYKIAKKFKTTIPLIKKVNGLKSDKIMPDMKLKIVTAPFAIKVDKSDNLLVLELGSRPLKRYRVATGSDNGTPVGTFTIVNKLENPTWFYAGAVVPPESPENILGTRWLGFDHKGYGIHGTTLPESIGKQETLGCVRMLNQEVEEIYDMVPVGTQVTVVD